MPRSTAKKLSNAYHHQGGCCIYCDRLMWLKSQGDFVKRYGISNAQAKWRQATVEHLIPKSEGGADASSNIAAACLFCNSHRHRVRVPLTPDKYRLFVQKRMRQGRWHQIPGALMIRPNERTRAASDLAI